MRIFLVWYLFKRIFRENVRGKKGSWRIARRSKRHILAAEIPLSAGSVRRGGLWWRCRWNERGKLPQEGATGHG